MANDYRPMLEHGLIQSIDDHTDLDTYFRGPDGLNVHKCYGYFASQATGDLFVNWFRQQNTA